MKPFTLYFYFLTAHLRLMEGSGSRLFGLEENIHREIRSYEIVSPQLHIRGRWRKDLSTTSGSGGHSRRLTLSVKGFGRDFILDVAQSRRLLSANFTSRYFSADGSEIVEKVKDDDHCFYQGTVQGLLHSVVAVSTCQGIEGMIFDGDETYFIQPAPGNTSEDKHIMYRTRDLKPTKKKCGVDHSSFSPAVSELLLDHKHTRTRRDVESETKFVELVMVNDFSQFDHLNRDIKATELRAKTIANLVDSLYRPLHVRIALIMVETWNRGDLAQVLESSDKTLDNFMKYRNEQLVRKQKHDNAQLLTHQSFSGSTVGKAAVMAMCTRRSGGVVQDHSVSAMGTAATLAHEMGHNFGMIHDQDVPGCKCDSVDENKACIMSSIAKNEPSTEWSSCSVDSFNKYLKRALDACLFNTPLTLFGEAICGNGFKEEGEECDCGTMEECLKYSDNCCNATTCKLHADSECDDGPCCEGCKIKPKRAVCRDQINDCDLPEFCTGKSELCPSNKYVQDGTPCANNKGYCYRSECPLHDEQCMDIWGKDAKSGPDGCFQMNTKGTVRWNCHQEDDSYTKCALEDIMCGMLQCVNNGDNSLPIIGSERNSYPYTVYVKDGPVECVSASVVIGQDVPDPGMTAEGTKCGEKKLCLNRKCSSVESLISRLPSCPNNCSNGNGVCNNEGECFCYSCWQSADCSVWEECKDFTAEPETRRSNLAGILIAVFLVIFLLIGAVFAFIYRRQLLQKWHNYKTKAPSGKRYHGVSTRTPDRSKDRKVAQTASKTTPESSKPRPVISQPKLNSTTRADPTVTITPNPLGSTRYSSGTVTQDQPQVALRPVPLKPVKPELPSPAKSQPPSSARPPPPQLRDRPLRPDKKGSLNRASSPPAVGEPAKSFVPRRPESHAGVLEKGPLPPPHAKKPPIKWPPEDTKQGIDNGQPKKALKPPAGINQAKFPRTPSEDRPTSMPLKPSDIKRGLGKDRPLSVPKAVASEQGHSKGRPPLKPPGPLPPRPGAKPPSS